MCKKIFVMIGVVVLLLFYNNYILQEKTTSPIESNDIITLVDNTVVQKIYCGVDYSQAILIKFGTFDRKNSGSMQARLLDSDNNLVQKWNVQLSNIGDDDYYRFKLKHKLEKDSNYLMEIKVNAKNEDNAVAIKIYNDEQEKNNNLTLDNVEQKTKMCDFKIEYSTFNFKIIILEIIIMIVMCISVFMAKRGKDIASKMIIIVSLAISYLILVPVNTVPDEFGHYLRSYEISLGNLVSGHNSEGEGLSYLPSGIQLDVSANMMESNQSGVYFNEKKLLNNKVDKDTFCEYSNPNQCLYSPVSYIAQSLGVLIGRNIFDRAILIFYMGRIINVLFQIVLIYFCFKWLPERSNLIFLIVCMPMFLQEMISYAADSTINCLSLFYFCYIWRVRREQARLSYKQYIGVFILSILLSLCKMVYFPLVLLVLCIPTNKFESKVKEISYKIIVIIGSISAFVGWFFVSMGYLQSEVHPGVNTPKQIKYVLTHIFSFVEICVNTTFKNVFKWMFTMVGEKLGWGNLPLEDIIIFSFLLLLILGFVFCPQGNKDKSETAINKMVIFICCIGVMGLTYASLYVQWTPLHAKLIEGIQGRYFIPLLLPITILFNRKQVFIEKQCINIFEICSVCILQIICFSSIYQFYV